MSMGRRNKPDGRNFCVKVFEPEPLVIARTLSPNSDSLAETPVFFRIPTADGRVQVKIAIIASPSVAPGAPLVGIPADVTLGGKLRAFLWLCIREMDEGSGLYLPTVDLVGTNAAPQAIPLNDGLMVFSESVLSDGDEVFGRLTLELNNETDVGPFETTVQVIDADEQFFEIGGGDSVPTSPGFVPAMGTLNSVEIELIAPNSNQQITYMAYKNGVQIPGFQETVPASDPATSVTLTGTPADFNGTTDVLDIVAIMNLGVGDETVQEISATAIFEAPPASDFQWRVNTKYTPMVEMCQEEWLELSKTFTPQIQGEKIVMEPNV